MLTVSADEARRISLGAQGLIGAPDRRGGVPALLRRMSAIQLDTISVLARTHELVPYSRLGPVGRPAVERALWGGDAFEYWAHAACVIPMEDWPAYGWLRRRLRAQSSQRGADQKVVKEVIRRIEVEGPLTATQLGGAKRGGPWWDWSAVKVAAEHLLNRGYLVCARRQSWKRVYDLPERAVPSALLEREMSDVEGRATLLRHAARAHGIGTWDDLTDYHRQHKTQALAAVEAAGLVEVKVEGWDKPAYALPEVLDAGPPRGRHRTTLLSPFDPVVWHRERAERIFGLRHRLEAYTPKAQREHGYFAMPLLTGGRIVGRVDPAREKGTLVARQVSIRSAADVPALVEALTEAASWVGCDQVTVERLTPEDLRPAVLAQLGGSAAARRSAPVSPA